MFSAQPRPSSEPKHNLHFPHCPPQSRASCRQSCPPSWPPPAWSMWPSPSAVVNIATWCFRCRRLHFLRAQMRAVKFRIFQSWHSVVHFIHKIFKNIRAVLNIYIFLNHIGCLRVQNSPAGCVSPLFVRDSTATVKSTANLATDTLFLE
jgi:hypothetical protein